MEITVTPIDATFGAMITGIDLASLGEADWSIIEQAFLDYAMLVFPGQNLSADEQSAFGHRFGETERLVPGMDLPSIPLSNAKSDGSVAKPEEHIFQVLKGNEGWHTDSSYMPLASKVAMLSAQVVPPEGGGTEWADMRAAYDALDADQQTRIAGLSAYHSLYYSQAEVGYVVKTGAGYGYHDKGAPLRPLVKVHPETGRKALFIGRHAYGIPGLSEDASRALLGELLAAACQPPRLYEHAWAPGDLVVWDNRCLLHRARPYDTSQPRVMLATRIAGDPGTELAPTVRDERASGFVPSKQNG